MPESGDGYLIFTFRPKVNNMVHNSLLTCYRGEGALQLLTWLTSPPFALWSNSVGGMLDTVPSAVIRHISLGLHNIIS